MDNLKIKDKASTIRVRTWGLTLAIVIALCLYFLVQVGWNNEVNLIDLIFVGSIQIVCHCLYFPDGELYGKRDEAFKANKKAYNAKASAINNNRKVGELREYCEAEYEQRKERYIRNACGKIGITVEELDALRTKPKNELLRLKSFEFDGKLIFFAKWQRKAIASLIYKPIPVEMNQADTILSSVENNTDKAISDSSVSYKTRVYVRKIFFALVVSSFLAYVGYSARDGITLAVIVKIATYIVSILSTAVLSFSSGESCSKIYKNKFYVDLANYIDGFFEWLSTEKKVDIKVGENT